MATTIMTNCTCGKEDPERATLPFIVGNVAASADQPAIVLLTIEGVWLATKGYADGIQKEGFQPLKEVMDSFLANGGRDLGVRRVRKAARHHRRTPYSRRQDCDRRDGRGSDGQGSLDARFLRHVQAAPLHLSLATQQIVVGVSPARYTQLARFARALP
jgi:hypothetical protein